MNRRRAVTLALDCMEREIKRLAINANMHDVMHLDAPACVAASARRKEIQQAMAALKEPQQERMKL